MVKIIINMVTDNNIYQSAIEALTEDGFVILQVLYPDGSSLFFNAIEFQEAFTSTASSVEFHSVKGQNVTNFFKNHGSNPDTTSVVYKFREYINNKSAIRCNFAKGLNWIKWGGV